MDKFNQYKIWIVNEKKRSDYKPNLTRRRHVRILGNRPMISRTIVRRLTSALLRLIRSTWVSAARSSIERRLVLLSRCTGRPHTIGRCIKRTSYPQYPLVITHYCYWCWNFENLWFVSRKKLFLLVHKILPTGLYLSSILVSNSLWVCVDTGHAVGIYKILIDHFYAI